MLDYIKECPGTIPGYILVVAVFLLLAVMARYIIIVLAINNYMHKTTILKHFINCFCGMAIYMAFLVVDYVNQKLSLHTCEPQKTYKVTKIFAKKQEISSYFNNCKALITENELFLKKSAKIFARFIFFLYLCPIFRA